MTVEETFELSVAGADQVAMQCRQPSLEGTGEISQRRLIRRRCGCGLTVSEGTRVEAAATARSVFGYASTQLAARAVSTDAGMCPAARRPAARAIHQLLSQAAVAAKAITGSTAIGTGSRHSGR